MYSYLKNNKTGLGVFHQTIRRMFNNNMGYNIMGKESNIKFLHGKMKSSHYLNMLSKHSVPQNGLEMTRSWLFQQNNWKIHMSKMCKSKKIKLPKHQPPKFLNLNIIENN